MSRPQSTALEALLQPSPEGVEVYSTVEIRQTDGTVYRFIHFEARTIGGASYLAKVENVSGLKETNTPATNRVSVTLSNIDKVWGKKVTDEARSLKMAKATARRYYPATGDHKVFFDGILAAPKPDEEQITFDIIPKSTAAGVCIATRSLSAANGFVNPDGDDRVEPPATGDTGIGGGELPPQCFAKGTLVYNDFNSLKPNDEFKRGDRILSFNPKTLELEPDTVTEVFTKEAAEVLEISFSDKTVLRVTKEHPFYTSDRVFAPVSYLQTGTKVYDFSKGKPEPVRLTAVKLIKEKVTVINFEVEKNKTYLPFGKAVHNRKYEDQPYPGGINLEY